MIARILSAAALSLMAPTAVAGVTIGYAEGDAVLFEVEAPDGWRVDTRFTTSVGAMPDGRAPEPGIVSLVCCRCRGRHFRFAWRVSRTSWS